MYYNTLISAICLLGFSCLMGLLLEKILDTSFVEQKTATGKIISKEYFPAISVMLPAIMPCPANYLVGVEYAGVRKKFTFTKEAHGRADVGMPIAIKYSQGRMTGRIYIKGIVSC